MESYFTVTIRYFSGEVESYNHVSNLSIRYGTNSNFLTFKDKDGKKHIIIGATITLDEETPCDADNALPSDVL